MGNGCVEQFNSGIAPRVWAMGLGVVVNDVGHGGFRDGQVT